MLFMPLFATPRHYIRCRCHDTRCRLLMLPPPAAMPLRRHDASHDMIRLRLPLTPSCHAAIIAFHAAIFDAGR